MRNTSPIFYGNFYGFRSPPFHVTPDASLLFATVTHHQALGAIEYGITACKGFIVVTGEVGVGKTTILRSVLDGLHPARWRIIYLFNPGIDIPGLYNAILEGLGSRTRVRAPTREALEVLQQALLDLHKRGMEIVLAVDEAQNMSESTLEHLRMLSNLETTKSKLLQIVLVGQPELDATLRRKSLRQLAQRVAVRARISPLTFLQCCRYVQHRLLCSGRPLEPPLFTLPALWYLAFKSRGNPRKLNIYCDNALINGYGHGAKRISLRIVWESAQMLRPRKFVAVQQLGWTAIVLIAAAAILALFRDLRAHARASATALSASYTYCSPATERLSSAEPKEQARALERLTQNLQRTYVPAIDRNTLQQPKN
jgi:general secretion pathway protein A